ncbi:hypothetical protein SARC_01535 [Sphaeroforma arctica JP610]|uniref:Uncharacterized protein n=1 Tax=Sphaeroforma arctica JP610 TaxID=667725 RepID=A0A0L0GBP1_9EUKA|nr:hypothetical protein SARC_01535 [Sphaeroforma arctica JP610]KNC86311.1 hypothetical protein SARC_01535 [Sphaeroforma arctica JP610]|eukprot:XP_014160213.1 hypothetical protein SARC_01535 [Sphaeroforma arctica JP610]
MPRYENTEHSDATNTTNSTTDETISERSPNNFESHRSPEQLHFGLYREKRKLAASLRESKSTSVMCDDMRNSLSIAGDLLRMDAMRSIRSMSVDVYYTQSTLEETDSETSFYPDKQRRSHHRGGMSEPEFLRTSGGGTARHTPFQNHGKAASEIRDAQHRTAVVDDNINTKNIDHNHYISKSKSEVTSPKNAIAQGDDPTPRKVENASVSSSCNRSTEHTTTSSDVPQSRDEEPKGEGSAVITSDYVETSTLQVSQSGGPRTRLENPTSGNLLASPAATAALSLDIHRKNSLGSSTGSPGNYPRADQGKGTECDTVKIANGNSLSESAVSPQVDSMMAATIHQSIPSPNQILLRGKGESTHHGTDYNAHTQHHIPLPQSGTATSTIQPDKIKKGYKSNTNSRPGSREIAGVQTPTKEKEKKEGKLKRLLGGKKSKRKQVSSNSKDGANDTGPNTSWDGSNSKDTNNESHIPSKEEHTLSASQEEAGSERSVSPNPHGRTLPRQTPDGVAVEDMGVGDRWAMLKGSTWSSPVDNPAAESSQFVASFSSSKANKEPANVRRRDRIDEDSACCDEPTHNRDQSAGNSLHTTAREQSADCINSESQSRWC